MNEEPHPTTLRVIRRITADQVLELEEVLDLARFLNENREARRRWPGSVLWKTLESVFEDGEISEEELVAVGSILQDIEAECAGIDLSADVPADVPIKTVDPIDIRSVDAEGFTLPESIGGVSMQTEGGRLFTVNLAGPSCECEEWSEKRARLPERHPGRICRHIALALKEQACKGQGGEWPESFRVMVEELADLFRGTPPDSEWRELRVNGRHYLLTLSGRDWAHVHGQGGEGGIERFSYRRRDSRWFFGAQPVDAGIVAAFVDSLNGENN